MKCLGPVLTKERTTQCERELERLALKKQFNLKRRKWPQLGILNLIHISFFCNLLGGPLCIQNLWAMHCPAVLGMTTKLGHERLCLEPENCEGMSG